MMRAIILNKMRDGTSGLEDESYFTISFDAPELEAALRRGGYGESGYEVNSVVGVEVIKEPGK